MARAAPTACRSSRRRTLSPRTRTCQPCLPAPCAGQYYESPSAFSIWIKRQVNPDRKADDGWKAVKYDGRWEDGTGRETGLWGRQVGGGCCKGGKGGGAQG